MEKNQEFEKAFHRLEEIVEKMNQGQVKLEDSLKLFEEGNRLIIFLNQTLNQAEKKIETLIKERNQELSLNEAGKPNVAPFEP